MGLVHIFQGPARKEENRTDGLLTESGGRGVHEAEGCQSHGGEDGVEYGRHTDNCEGLGWAGGSLTLSGLVD